MDGRMSTVDLRLFEPDELNLPSKFACFREIQAQAVEWTQSVFQSGKRFAGVCLPTGAGKTLYAMALARVLGVPTVILTSTKGLQEQYLDDFASAGLVDIRGKENYACVGKPPARCKYGPHEGCLLAGDLGCTYESARWEAKQAKTLITNYSYWVRANIFGPGGLRATVGPPGAQEVSDPWGLLICDEGHHAMEALAGALRVQVTERQLRAIGLGEYWKEKASGDTSDEIMPWKELAEAIAIRAQSELKSSVELLRVSAKSGVAQGKLIMLRERVRDLDTLTQSLDSIVGMQDKDWVVEQRQGTTVGRVWTFDCVWPGMWSEKLWCQIPNVVVMSATLKPMSMNLLGIKKEEREYKEWDRIFPAVRTPIVHVNTVRLNKNTKEEGLLRWVARIDEIVESRAIKGKRKGLIHTVSYARQQFYMENSRWRDSGVFDWNSSTDPESGTARDVYERFLGVKGGEAGSVLVSPSFSTGWDFRDDECRWQVIGKIPFPDSRGKVMKARMERDDRYLNYVAMQDLVQACGRGTRWEKDWCEVFVVDDSVKWFLWQNKNLAPDWFTVRSVNEVPEPIRF